MKRIYECRIICQKEWDDRYCDDIRMLNTSVPVAMSSGASASLAAAAGAIAAVIRITSEPHRGTIFKTM